MVGRFGIPVHKPKRDGSSIRAVYFGSQGVLAADHGVRIGNLVPVEPDVCSIIDPEATRRRSISFRRPARERKDCSVPPWSLEQRIRNVFEISSLR